MLPSWKSFILAGLSLVILAAVAIADPVTIPFQGRLIDASGRPVIGTKLVHFSFWDAETLGTQVLSPDFQSSITTDGG